MYINISQLTKRIGKNVILDDISLSLESGQIYGLWGINGSGKTMLMRTIAGLVRPTSGKITVDGRVLGKDISFPQSMGLLLENPAFLDSYSGFENLRLLAEIKGEIGDNQIRETLQNVGLDANDKRKYRKYSLGMKQKLGIAAAIMEHPKLVLLDEPTNSLDESSVRNLIQLINTTINEETLIVVSCHDREFLYAVSDMIYHINDGKNEGCIYDKNNSN